VNVIAKKRILGSPWLGIEREPIYIRDSRLQGHRHHYHHINGLFFKQKKIPGGQLARAQGSWLKACSFWMSNDNGNGIAWKIGAESLPEALTRHLPTNSKFCPQKQAYA